MGSNCRAKLFFPWLVGSTLVVGACGSDDGGGSPPELDPLSDQVALVDSEFTLRIAATDPDGDALQFGFKSTIEDIESRADLRQAGDKAVFRWTPIAADAGSASFDFTVSDGQSSDKETITIEVRPSAGTSTAPIFRKPLGTGTTLDLTQKSCIDVDVVVEDADSPGVTIAQVDPVIEGATLDQDDGLSGSWSWCPSKKQVDESDRHVLKLSADDGDNPATTKNFLIVLRKAQKQDCPGQAPVIEHTPPGDISTVLGLTIDAHVTDDNGIKYEPLLYYSTEPPSDPPDLAQMTQITMESVSGDMKDGMWTADIPNPVASEPAGTSASVHYLIVAQDNDDKEGDCDHLVQSPESGVYELTVTNPGGSGGLGLCEPCTTDNQCGGEGDFCMLMGTEGGSFCFRGCSGDQDCPEEGYYCTITDFMSVDGAEGRQCIPESFRCDGGGSGTCDDDDWEENDTRLEALGIYPGLQPGDHTGLKSCPGSVSADEDWYPIDIDDPGTITAMLDGGDSSDLDLSLVNEQGDVLATSDGLTSQEILDECVEEGVYYLRVYTFMNEENTYTLSYDFTQEECAQPSCQDDPNEEDDDMNTARNVDLNNPPFTSTTNAICSWDEDWYAVFLFSGETLYSTLTFEQTTASEDLDLILYKGTTNLTPCDETTMSGCDVANGQSGTSNETLTWTIEEDEVYYLVVRGFDGAENLYDICIGLDENDCPTP